MTHQRGPKEDAVIEVQRGLNAQSLRFISILIDNAIEVEIDDFPVEAGSQPLRVKIPLPGAYISHKGLVFAQRTREQKKAKDIYYIFEILANCLQLREQMITELKELKVSYPDSWFRRFKRNLRIYFFTTTSDGANLVLKQRPNDAFPNLNSEQFKQYVIGIFQEFFDEIESL